MAEKVSELYYPQRSKQQ